MTQEMVVALLGFAGTLTGSLLGVITAQKLTQYRLSQLEEKVSRHNNLVERTYKIEGELAKCVQDIRELKVYHKPISN